MKFLQEITVWAGNIPNHLYVMDDSKDRMIAYRPAGSDKFFTFKKPVKIDLRGRKFTEVKNTFGFTTDEEVPEGTVIKVAGSKGEVYTVVKNGAQITCSCAGFKFRGKCKHAESAKS